MIGAAAAQPAASGNAPAGNTDKLANQEVFLQLLVAQIKNQDPLKPTDGVQYLTQLAQFSSLEQLIGIRAELKNISQAPPVADPAGDVTGN
ncbi:MAG: hypothetical protein HYR60_28560 [Acidobacteria bacterium]|nr:hypothetical protein [Acidobacteriota bacterium]MBI3472521.1 hypothetical protein [Candidatus Solibacter usitatus]